MYWIIAGWFVCSVAIYIIGRWGIARDRKTSRGFTLKEWKYGPLWSQEDRRLWVIIAIIAPPLIVALVLSLIIAVPVAFILTPTRNVDKAAKW